MTTELTYLWLKALFTPINGATRTSPWWATNVRVGWEGQAGGMRLAPFIGVNNAFNHKYVSSVVINAAANRFYEPAPGLNAYFGLSVGAGR